jgi:hypothetical protein
MFNSVIVTSGAALYSDRYYLLYGLSTGTNNYEFGQFCDYISLDPDPKTAHELALGIIINL